jgi:hypothetical protein
MEIIQSWKCGIDLNKAPYIHSGDMLIKELPNYSYTTYNSFVKSADFGQTGKGFHFGLIPGPYSGDILGAKVYLLMLNPGFAPIDYYAQEKCKPFRDAVKNDIRQNLDDKFPFMNLDPRFAWTGGGQYWNRKLEAVVNIIKGRKKYTYNNSLSYLSKKLCTLEIVPYHSREYSLPSKFYNEMTTPKLMKSFITDYVLPKAKKEKACIIVTRGNQYWGLKKQKNIVIYSGSEARSAYLTPDSRGGKLLLEYLL